MGTENGIGDEGAVALSQCLQHVPHLTHLNLSCECILMCALIDVLVGVILVCDVLHLMCDVCDVSIVNYIGHEGATTLSQCLHHVPHLTQLDLSRECILMCALIDMWID